MKNSLRNSSFLRHTFSQRGTILIEALIGAVLLGIGVVAMMEVTSGTMTVYKKADNVMSFNSLQTRINSWIATEQTCRLAFGGPTIIKNVASELTTQVSNAQPNGETQIIIYLPEFKILEDRKPFADRASSATPSPDKENTLWKFESIALKPLSGTWKSGAVNPAEVEFKARPMNTMNSALGGKTQLRGFAGELPKVRLVIMLDASLHIVTCGPLSFNSSNYFDNPADPNWHPEWDMAPTQPCPAGYAAQSNGVEVTCVRVDCGPAGVPATPGNGEPTWGLQCPP